MTHEERSRRARLWRFNHIFVVFFLPEGVWVRSVAVPNGLKLFSHRCRQKDRLPRWCSGCEAMYDFRQQESMAKRGVIFAGSRIVCFYITHRTHLNSYGLLQLGSSSATLHILPLWQAGQVVTSMLQILNNCSCQVSCLTVSFITFLPHPRILRHNAMLFLRFLFANRPKWRIRT